MPSIPELQDAPPAGPVSRRTLPSGRSILLHRPRGFDSEQWDMAESGGLFRVRRPRPGNSAEHEYARDPGGRPLELVEEDARALVTLLNGLLREALEQAVTRRSTRTRRSA